MTLFIIIFLLLLVIPDISIWQLYIRPLSVYINLLWWLPAAVALLLSAVWMCGWWSEGMVKAFFVILMCFALPKLLFLLCSVIGLAAGRFLPQLSPLFNAAGIISALTLCGCSIYGFTGGLKRLETLFAEVESDRLPEAFDGYRIVHISDLHTGTFGRDTAFIQKLVDRVNSLRPDAIVFTGDIVNSSPEELAPHKRILAQLKARDGVFSVLGNHDYCEYARYDRPDGAARNTLKIIGIEREMGWQVLMNEHRIVKRGGDEIAIVGVENSGRPPFPARGDLAKAANGLPDSLFKVLLSHDPTHWRREVLPSSSADLMLAGHTHAMQFQIFGFSPSSWSYREWGGLYTEGGRSLYVSKGTGGTAPFRFGAWPEITEITLKKSKI